MSCPECQQENPATAKFCLACGVPLRRACTQCGTDLPAYARFCIECGHPTAPASPRPTEAPPPPPVRNSTDDQPAPAAPGRVILERPAVLHALYEQGRDALRRGDRGASAVALAAVVEEAPNAYPDAHRLLAEALERGTAGRVATRSLRSARAGAATARRQIAPAAAVALVWLARSHALLGRALQRVPGARPALAAVAPWLAPARPALAAIGSRGALTWALVLALTLPLAVLLVQRGGAVAPPAAVAEEAAPVPTVEAVADLFARCQAAVGAENWADAIRACRILHARAPDYNGLADALAAAYVGRGQQRQAAGDDLAAAEADFRQALSYQPDSAEAQSALQRLTLYRAGEKALVVGDWPTAVSQFSAVYSEAPDYLQNLGARSAKGKLFAAWLAWGQSALNADAAPDAAERCGQALALVPDDPDAQRCIAAAQGPNGDDGDLVAAEPANG